MSLPCGLATRRGSRGGLRCCGIRSAGRFDVAVEGGRGRRWRGHSLDVRQQAARRAVHGEMKSRDDGRRVGGPLRIYIPAAARLLPVWRRPRRGETEAESKNMATQRSGRPFARRGASSSQRVARTMSGARGPGKFALSRRSKS